MRRIVASILVIVGIRCGEQPPLVIVTTVDGPEAWASGYLVGDGQPWSLFPHSDRVEDLLAGVYEGFHAPWAYKAPGNLRGQGSLVTLASREGWATAVFSAPSDGIQPIVAHLASSAGTSALYPCSPESWQTVKGDLARWAAVNRAPRLAVVHLSLDPLPLGSAGAQALHDLWRTLEAIVRQGGRGSALVAAYLPNPCTATGRGLLRVQGEVPGDVLPRDIRLSTLDIAPSIAATLNLHYTPDYPGQSLAALREAGRVEPLPFVRGATSMVMGNRWVACAEAFEDTALASNVRFFDLWSGRFALAGMADPAALALLDSLPRRAKTVP